MWKLQKEKIRKVKVKKITVLCVGNLKENYLKSGCEEYLKRLSKFYDIIFNHIMWTNKCLD